MLGFWKRHFVKVVEVDTELPIDKLEEVIRVTSTPNFLFLFLNLKKFQTIESRKRRQRTDLTNSKWFNNPNDMRLLSTINELNLCTSGIIRRIKQILELLVYNMTRSIKNFFFYLL